MRNVATGEAVEITPKVGLDSSGRVLSVGDPVDPTAARVLMPFEHPRVLIEDFAGAEKLVQHAIRKLYGKGPLSPAPIVVVHPDFELDGGLTQIEARALLEMAEGAGARKAYVHYGRQLTDQEIASLSVQESDPLK